MTDQEGTPRPLTALTDAEEERLRAIIEEKAQNGGSVAAVNAARLLVTLDYLRRVEQAARALLREVAEYGVSWDDSSGGCRFCSSEDETHAADCVFAALAEALDTDDPREPSTAPSVPCSVCSGAGWLPADVHAERIAALAHSPAIRDDPTLRGETCSICGAVAPGEHGQGCQWSIRDETPDGLRAALKDIAAVALEGHREHGYRRPAGEFFKTIIDLAEAALRSTGPGDTDGGLDVRRVAIEALDYIARVAVNGDEGVHTKRLITIAETARDAVAVLEQRATAALTGSPDTSADPS